MYISLHRGNGFYPNTGAATDVGSGAGQGFTVNVRLTLAICLASVAPGQLPAFYAALPRHRSEKSFRQACGTVMCQDALQDAPT